MLKKLIAAVLTATMLLLLAVPALAATTQTSGYRIATTNVNVRTGPNSTKYPAIGYLVKGELVSFVSQSGDWTKIAFKGTTGYVFSKYLMNPLSQTPKYYRSATEPVNVRTGPDSGKYPIIGSLKKGEAVQYLGDSGNWAMVLYKGDIGFVYSSYLTRPTTGGGDDPAPAPNQYRVATTNVNVRTGPSTNYSAIGYLSKGEMVQYLGASGDWSKVLYKGKVGFVYSQYLVKPSTGGDDDPAPAQYRVATTAVNVRTGPNSVKYPAIGYLNKGETVQYLGASGDWSKVLFHGKVGYVYSQYLAKQQPDFSNPVKATAEGGNVRLQLVLSKSTYKVNEPIDCYAVVKNIGSRDTLKVYGTRQLVYFPIKSISGNKLFNGEYFTTEEFAETTLTKTKPLTYGFVKSGSLSDEASDAFEKEYFSTNTLRLPAGKYQISAQMNYATNPGNQRLTLTATTVITVK